MRSSTFVEDLAIVFKIEISGQLCGTPFLVYGSVVGLCANRSCALKFKRRIHTGVRCHADAAAKIKSSHFLGVTELRFLVTDVSGRLLGPGISLEPIDSPETLVTTLRKVTSKKNEHPGARSFVTKADVSVAVAYIIGWNRYPAGCFQCRISTAVL